MDTSVRYVSTDAINDGFSAGENELRMLVESIDIPLRGLTVVRPVHSTVLHRSHCFQITTPLETRYFTCSSADDATNWVSGLKEIIYPNRDRESRIDTSLDVWLFEAKGLPPKKRYYCEVVLDKVLYGRTSTKLKSDILFWGEQFSFDDLPNVQKLCLYVFRENDSKKKRKERSVFVGSVEVPLDAIPANNEVEKWLPLRLPGTSPRPSPKNASNKNDQLSIRVKVKYQTVSILPISNYSDFHEYIKRNYFTLCKELEPVISLKAKDELAQTLLRILQATKQAKEFLADIIIAEVNSLENENLTFRGNTLATKSMDTYMKMVGNKYLQKTFAEFVKGLYDFEEEFEVDPTKLTNGNLLDNQKNLLKLVEEAWSLVLGSYYIFPVELQEALYVIKKRCEAVKKDVSIKLISGSVFLRFLCPAILSPSLFHLTREYPDEKTGRCLTLIAKALQNLANFTRFGGKEEYMESLNEFVERELPNMKNFLDLISSKPKHSGQGSVDGYIDIGRELAVLAKLLAEQLPMLSKESQAKLHPLRETLESLTQFSYQAFHPKSQSLNGLQTEKLAPMTRSYSMPRDTEYRKFRGMANKTKTSVNLNLYQDSTLSSAQDYVSGCSLITHTSLKSKSSSTSRTKGRAAEHKLRFWSSSRPGKTSQDPSLSVDQSNFIRSSSFHGRSSRDERMNNLSVSRSFDSGGRPKNLSLTKPNLKQKTFSDPPDLVGSNSSSHLRFSADDSVRFISSKNTTHNISSNGKSASSSMLSDSIIDGDKTIRRLPDIIHESVTWNDITHQPDQPLYFSPATEPMTPLGNRSFKFGFGDNDEAEFDRESSERGTMKPYSNSDLALSQDTVNSQPLLKLSNTQHPAIPISYNTWSSKSSDSDSLTRSGNYSSSFQDLNSNGINSTKHPDDTASHVDSSPLPTASVTIVYTNEEGIDNGDDNEQKPHSDSLLSGYSSICSDHERGSLGSIETCSYTSSEEPDNAGSHNYHNCVGSTKLRRRAQLQLGTFCDDRPKTSSNRAEERQGMQSDKDRTIPNGDDESTSNFKTPEEYELEIAELKRQLSQSQVKLRRKDEELTKVSLSYGQSAASYKKKLSEAEMKLKKQKKEQNEQMKSIITRLMKVEGELGKEQSDMQEVVEAKQRIIEVQEKRIKSLDSANRRLVSALTQLRNKYTGRNGTVAQNRPMNGPSEQKLPKDKRGERNDRMDPGSV